MEDFYSNNDTLNDGNFSFDNSRNETYYSNGFHGVFKYVAPCIICLGLVVTLAAITAVCTLVKKNQAAPVYIINLLISDLIQLCSALKLMTSFDVVTLLIYFASLLAGVGFMVCVSMERYLVIAKPLWYRFRRNIRSSLMICAVIWTIAVLLTVAEWFFYVWTSNELFPFFFLLPLPFFIFFLVGTIRALSAAVCVPADEKRRIVAVLVLVLLVYILLFLPSILFVYSVENFLHMTSQLCLLAVPLADASLYLLLKKGAVDKLLASLCCCKILNNQQTSTMCEDTVSTRCTETV